MIPTCPMCEADLELILVSSLGSISRFDCYQCLRYSRSDDTELIKTKDGAWLLLVKEDELWLFPPNVKKDLETMLEKALSFPRPATINYKNPQETIDRLIKLKAFL